MNTQLQYEDMTITTLDSIRIANEMIWRFARDSPIRALAMEITKPVRDDSRRYPKAIWQWIRDHVEYRQEIPGVEVLQGPYHTLPAVTVGSFTFPGFGVGDCDDLSIAFATLCTSINCPAYLAGLARRPNVDAFFHAKGYCMGVFWELSKDEPYGGDPTKPLITAGLMRDEVALIYIPQQGTFVSLEPEGT